MELDDIALGKSNDGEHLFSICVAANEFFFFNGLRREHVHGCIGRFVGDVPTSGDDGLVFKGIFDYSLTTSADHICEAGYDFFPVPGGVNDRAKLTDFTGDGTVCALGVHLNRCVGVNIEIDLLVFFICYHIHLVFIAVIVYFVNVLFVIILPLCRQMSIGNLHVYKIWLY